MQLPTGHSSKELKLTRITKRRRLLWIAAGVAICLAVATQMLQRMGKVDSVDLIGQSEAALARKDVKTAGALLDQVLTHEPANAAALIQRGKLWESIGESENALADWRQIDVADSRDSSSKLAGEARFLEGALQVKLHRAPAAERALLESWELHNRDNLQALELLLRVYVLQLRRDEVRRVLNVLEQRRPLTLEEMVLRADAGAPIIAEGDALVQLREFIAADPEDMSSVVALTRYLMSSENFSEAENVLKSVSAKLSKASPILGLRALCQLQLGFSDKALATLQTPTREESLDYWWWLAAGELAETSKQAKLAADCFRLASLSQPDSGYARYRYGLALQANGQTAAAQEQLQAAALIDRLHQQTVAITRMANMAPAQFVNGLLQIAQLQVQLQNSPEAAAWARLALQLDPTNKTALALNRVPTNDQAANSSTGLTRDDAAQKNLLQWLSSHSNETVAQDKPTALSSGKDSLRLQDVHRVAQLDFQYFNGNSGSKYLIESMGGGVSVLDFDCDGWPDCYFPQGCKFPIDLNDFTYVDQLYRNIDGQRFANVTTLSRLFENGYSQGAAAADINNDGFGDVVVANFGRNRVFINQGDGTFIDSTEQWGLQESEMSSSLGLADMDQDGNLDLYVVNYVDELRVCRDTAGNVSTCNPQNFTGVQDRLYKNSGDGRFLEVTREAGMLTADGKGLGVVITDLDDDGLVDIYVSNDTTANFLFKNLGGMRFQEIGLESGTALSDEGQAQAGMGIAAGDLNGDLKTDLYVTNFLHEANNLYINGGAMTFHDEAINAKLSLPSKRMLGFGTQAEDIDLDGDLDLIVANGHIDDYTSRGDPWKMPTQLFCNLGNGVFSDCSNSAGEYFREPYLGRGIAALDWNRDGRKDFIVVHQDRAVALLENQSPPSDRSLTVRLIGRASNRDAIGAQVIFQSGGKSQRRDIHGGDGFYCTNERAICAGTAEGRIDTVRVRWPSGKKQTLELAEGASELMLTEN
jgi:tetratricopeptide (TPR) repeat protein